MFSKILSYTKLHWAWLFVLLPLALYLFNYADSHIRTANTTINYNTSIQNAVVDDFGSALPGKEGIFKDAQSKIYNAKSQSAFYQPLIYISAGIVCLLLILLTSALMGYAFTEFKLLHFIGMFNKNGLTESEAASAQNAFYGMFIILMINSAVWIPLTLIYVKSIAP